jgi:hypothetical protein
VSAGFGAAPSGFGQPPQPQSGFNQAPQAGFGTQPPSGFGQAPPSSSAFTAFGNNAAASPFNLPSAHDVEPIPYTPPGGATPALPSNYGGTPADFGSAAFGVAPSAGHYDAAENIRFTEDLGGKMTQDKLHWGFGACLVFLLKMCIPIYGLIILIGCLVGNTRKYPSQITNMMRASVVVGILLTVVGVIIGVVVTALLAQAAMSVLF